MLPIWVKPALLMLMVLGLGAGWYWVLMHEREIGYAKAVGEYTVLLAAAKDAARLKEQSWTKQLEDARNESIKREQDKDRRLAAAAVATAGLRGTVTDLRSQLPGDSLGACRATADTLAVVFGECQGRYTEMAGIAEGHLNDAVTCHEAWPRR